ncbi:MAG: polysaccharide biosynthesis/export family protein [Chitinophagaceae bacterium]
MRRRSGIFSLTVFTLAITLFSCKTTKNVFYAKELIDSTKNIIIPQASIPVPTIKPYDLLLINFYGKGLDMTSMMNSFGGLEVAQKMSSASSLQLAPGYLVSADGYIELPQLGKLKVAGMTLKQLKADLTQRVSEIMVDPTVLVKFSSFKVTMVGEVGNKGDIVTKNEKLSIIEAIGLSGDITLYGQKDKVKVIRTGDTTTTIGTIDLTSKDAFKSEYFFLQPNDVVYVPSNGLLQQQQKLSAVLPFLSVGISILSIIITIAAVLKKN